MDRPTTDRNETPAPQNRARIPTFFLAGYQKTASTWLHHCFLEHPDIFVPPRDTTHFFDIYYHRGVAWYESLFADVRGQSQIGDTTPTYMRFLKSRVRMAELNPEARILVTLRNPIERAFSHYWHEKKKRKINYCFADCLGKNVDIYDHWLASGFYYSHLTHLFTLFPRDQVLVLFYEDLTTSPSDFLRQVLNFLDVDVDFVPSMLDIKVNKAWFRPTWSEKIANLRKGRPIRESEYDRGIDPEFRSKLQEVFRDENRKLEELVGRDLSHWK